MKLTDDEIKLIIAMLVIGDDREILLDTFGDEDSAIDAIEQLESRGLISGNGDLFEFFTSKGYDWLVKSRQIEPSLFSKSLLMRPTPYCWSLTVDGFDYTATRDIENPESLQSGPTG